jgi:hypothetical protein
VSHPVEPLSYNRPFVANTVNQAHKSIGRLCGGRQSGKKGGLKAILALDKSTHPMSPSAGECDYIVDGVFTRPRPIAVPSLQRKTPHTAGFFSNNFNYLLVSMKHASVL